MELRHLEYFLAVAEELNFTRAAKRLHVVQSGVSSAVHSLERELDAALFDRTNKRVALTDAGRALLPEARTALASVQAARDAVHQVRGGLRGTVRVGTMTSVGIVDLPALFGRFHARYPGVSIRLQAAPSGSAGLARSVLDGELDMAFLSLTGQPPARLLVRRLASVPMVAVLPGDHPHGDQDRITWAQLADSPFIDSPPGYGNRALVDREIEAAGLVRNVAVEVSDVSTAAAYVRHGLGVAVMPAFAVPRDDPGLRVLPLEDGQPHWSLSVATATDRRPSAALTALLSLVEDHVRDAPDDRFARWV
ncbi:LysR family transcriptional regulator [Streptomyces sp. NPDC051569]|uniref:LysR family transcriptional regulator n=1 Tax=Streptomyces sp. NPDC051569 TaxID=3365661 RepID=UPI0037932609